MCMCVRTIYRVGEEPGIQEVGWATLWNRDLASYCNF